MDKQTNNSNKMSSDDFVIDWKKNFTKRIKEESKSKKQVFTYKDALKNSTNSRNELDKIIIEYLNFINSDPLQDNDYFKYVDAYRKGEKLNEKFFRHNKQKLHRYYEKFDKDPEGYNPFSVKQYQKYVLFMMLKFSEHYKPEYDLMFDVKILKNREYNPLTSIPSVLRQSLPFLIKEYDIVQAYPSFIFMELGMEPFDVYQQIDKTVFNSALNVHKHVKNAKIEKVRTKLKPIYGNLVNEVITEARFNIKGKLFEDLSKYEAEYIKLFVESNSLENYVRLHDGVVTRSNVKCQFLDFKKIKFKTKEFKRPTFEKEIINFYDSDQKTSPARYCKFFEQEGYLRITKEGQDSLTIIKNENRVVSPINHKTDIVPMLKENINELNTENLQNLIATDSKYVIQQSLQLLTPIKLKYHKDTRTQCDISFKNGVARITKDGVKVIDYDEIDGLFTKHSTQKHEFKVCDLDKKQCDFGLFLMMAATNKDVRSSELTQSDRSAITAFYSMFGYLILNYKDPSFNPAIILSDENANNELRDGGRGKSLLQTALKHIRCSIEKGGDAYNPSYIHNYADLYPKHDIYIIDDLPCNFNYDALFTSITGGITAQRKNIPAEEIFFEDAPKFVLSTNYAVRYDDNASSTNRRFREYKFSKFWNINYTPKDVFEKAFFTEWNEEEWNRFYNFAISCVQYYLEYGLETIAYNKEADNFAAYFNNDAIIEETVRIFKALGSQETISVTNFVNEHKRSETYRFDPFFSVKNARKYIEIFIKHYGEPFIYSKKLRKWERIVENSDLGADCDF